MVKLLDREKLRAELEMALNKTVVRAYNAYGQVTLGWNHNVDFNAVPLPLERIITSPDEIFNYVEFGTRPHEIVAKNAPNLVFRPGTTPKTYPGVLASYPSIPGNSIIAKHRVHHPGTEPRHFSAEVAKIVRPYLRALVEEALVASGAQGNSMVFTPVPSITVSGKSAKPKKAPKPPTPKKPKTSKPLNVLPSLKGIKLPKKPK